MTRHILLINQHKHKPIREIITFRYNFVIKSLSKSWNRYRESMVKSGSEIRPTHRKKHHMSYEQQQLFYTQDDLDNKVAEIQNSLSTETEFRVQRAKDNLNADHAVEVLAALRECRDNDIISADTAVEVYNVIADRLGWERISTLQSLFTVSVSYMGWDIAEFTDVEADDSTHATELVLENMEVEATMSITLSYNGDSQDNSFDIGEWDLDSDQFSAEAVEQ